jgi:hypothetical protein
MMIGDLDYTIFEIFCKGAEIGVGESNRLATPPITQWSLFLHYHSYRAMYYTKDLS